jgi:hypothetical protein
MLADDVARAAAHDGEMVTYRAGGVAEGVTISAVVRRQARETDGSDPRDFRRARIKITITNRASDGVTTVDRLKDLVELKARVNDTSDTVHKVVEIANNDAGSWTLELER